MDFSQSSSMPMAMGVVGPCLQVARGADTPLVSSETVERAVMPLVEEPVEIERAVVEERNAVAYELFPSGRGEILHLSGLHGGVVFCRSLRLRCRQ